MSENELLGGIAINPKVMVGKPVIKGTRLTVEYVLNLLAHGTTFEEILQEYEGLTQEDIQACLLFATRSLESTTNPVSANPPSFNDFDAKSGLLSSKRLFQGN
jgi:uncharacterized protein (DUF433 family)